VRGEIIAGLVLPFVFGIAFAGLRNDIGALPGAALALSMILAKPSRSRICSISASISCAHRSGTTPSRAAETKTGCEIITPLPELMRRPQVLRVGALQFKAIRTRMQG